MLVAESHLGPIKEKPFYLLRSIYLASLPMFFVFTINIDEVVYFTVKKVATICVELIFVVLKIHLVLDYQAENDVVEG